MFESWLEYSDHYERQFPTPDNKTPLKMLEIGVHSGGSARTWKQYYGSPLTYVGVDTDARCKRTEKPKENVFIEIGSQLEAQFLRSVCSKHGPFDMVVDNGLHTAEAMNTSLSTIFSFDNCLTRQAIYAIEAMYSMTMCRHGSYCRTAHDIYDIVGKTFYSMHAHWETNPTVQADPVDPALLPWAKQVRGIVLYDSIAFFHRDTPLANLTRVHRGNDTFFGDVYTLNPPGTYTHGSQDAAPAPSEPGEDPSQPDPASGL